MKALILAGGSGTRLWPASTNETPKQFLDINGDGALLSQTLDRCGRLGIGESCYVITRDSFEAQVAQLLTAFNGTGSDHIILEPMARNTAPAILLAAKFLQYQANAGLDDVMLVLPSDHLIEEDAKLPLYFSLGEELAKDGNIVIFGIVPDRPETGYGYIKAKSTPLRDKQSVKWLVQALPVSSFKEKPSREVAESYLAEGGYFWNAGMFALTLRTLYSELEKHLPEIQPFLELNYEELRQDFSELPKISFDFAVMEKTNSAVVIPLEVQWSDVGSWDSVYEILPKDNNRNAVQGKVIAIDTTDSLLINKTEQPVAIIGQEGVIAIQTEDGLLISKLGGSQKVGDLANKLKPQDTEKTLVVAGPHS